MGRIMTDTANAHVRLARIQREARTRAALVRVLRRHYTAYELGVMFDALPDTDVEPLSTLIDAVGTAWSDELAAERRTTGNDPE